VAIAPNYYHRTTKNMNLGYTDADMVEGRKHKEQTTRDGLLTDLQATIRFLQANHGVFPKERIGCVGFCFGGHVAYIAAGLPVMAASATFYPGGVAIMSPGGGPATVAYTPQIQGEILCLFGEQDPIISHEQTVTIEKALESAGVRHEIVRYSHAGHGFFCNHREDYDASAAEDAWHRLQSLFARTLR
jgi:carboxymethylenebutenolidase